MHADDNAALRTGDYARVYAFHRRLAPREALCFRTPTVLAGAESLPSAEYDHLVSVLITRFALADDDDDEAGATPPAQLAAPGKIATLMVETLPSDAGKPEAFAVAAVSTGPSEGDRLAGLSNALGQHRGCVDLRARVEADGFTRVFAEGNAHVVVSGEVHVGAVAELSDLFQDGLDGEGGFVSDELMEQFRHIAALLNADQQQRQQQTPPGQQQQGSAAGDRRGRPTAVATGEAQARMSPSDAMAAALRAVLEGNGDGPRPNRANPRRETRAGRQRR